MCLNLKWCITFSSIFGLIQSILWFGFGLAGALTYLCVIPVTPYKDKSDFFRVTLVKLYFEGPGCIPNGSYLGDFNEKYRREIDLFTPDRVFAVMVSYVIFNAFYFLFSINLYTNRKTQHQRLSIIVWSSITLIQCVIDATLTYEAIRDIFTLTDYMNSDGPELTDVYTSSAKNTLGEIPYISLVLALMSSRLVVFWMWNFVIGAFLFFDALCCRGRPPKVNENKYEKRKEKKEELWQGTENRSTSVSLTNGKYISAFDTQSNPDSINYKRSMMEAVTRFPSIPENIQHKNWSHTANSELWPSKPHSSKSLEITNESFVSDEPDEPDEPGESEGELDFDHNLKNFESGQKKITIMKPPNSKSVDIPIPPPIPPPIPAKDSCNC